ncbi:MAG TPA: SLBB domain-containing protein, partial [Gammaproteobacteria bacterium]|nr:SLBB domain-containing protein [Gammaproteobacteria bacterium]
TIFFPYVGIVNVAGRTVGQVREEVTQRLTRYIQNPQLDVRVVSFRSKKVEVSGAVGKPGEVPITDVPLTLLQALQLAGGGTAQAALQNVEVVRDGAVHTFDVQALLDRGDMRQDILLQDKDVVYVPDTSYYSVHVLGEVKTPGDVPLIRARLNLAEAITKRGGFNIQNANLARVFVFRGAPQKPKIYWLDAKSPVAMLLATQFQMQPQDVVFIASTGLARWNRLVGLILPTVQTLWQTQSLINQFK